MSSDINFVPSRELDQPVLSDSLIRIFTEHILDSQGCKFLRAENKDFYLTGTQADLILRWGHTLVQ